MDQFAKRSKGIGSGFNRLYTPDFGAVPCVVPPRGEQLAIVRFLDHADRQPYPGLHPREGKADQAAGGAEAGHHPPGRHGPDRCPNRPTVSGLQGLRGGVAGGGTEALDAIASEGRVPVPQPDLPDVPHGVPALDLDRRGSRMTSRRGHRPLPRPRTGISAYQAIRMIERRAEVPPGSRARSTMSRPAVSGLGLRSGVVGEVRASGDAL